MSQPITLTIEPLTQTAFAPYGDVIETEDRDSMPMNAGMAQRFHALADVDVIGEEGRGIISLVEAKLFEMPKTVTFVERHPLGSQAFIPMDDTPFLVVVAPPTDKVDLNQMKAFITNGRQGINYHRGTWHHVLLTPFAPMRFICVDRAGKGNNCEEFWFSEGEQPYLSQS
ncbi:ureidoglycolate lyase [Leucothrix pacifica]|uniref:Ureidoglycolate lyase n=1 Tax=Leucothrix pacifica TaxID=1247513 RepID=A0A317C2C8_9GAMM|nr:ureidoglycolate lyase [Leucothrix pacifica]PWQ92507.1 ureidoglycolate lyase [Leucothrix pacifica]